MDILLTGATGYIGSYLTEYLSEEASNEVIPLYKKLPDSPTYCKWFAVEFTAHPSETAHRSPLTAAYKMLYIPEGFAHGFQTLEDNTVVFYQMSEFYHPECARGVRWNDPAFGIKWPETPTLISKKDKSYFSWTK